MDKDRIENHVDTLEEVIDYRVYQINDVVEGIIDVDRSSVSNVDAYAEELNEIVSVTDCGVVENPKKLGGPFVGMESTETYDCIVYRYEFKVAV